MKKLLLTTLALGLLGSPVFAADQPVEQPADKPMMGCPMMKDKPMKGCCCCCKGMEKPETAPPATNK